MGDALGVGIDRRQRGADEGQLNRQCIGEQHQAEGQSQQAREQQQGLALCHAPRRHRPIARALHLAVEPGVVGVVVDDAAGGAHDEHAEGEDHEHARRRKVACGQPQCPPGRPQQQQGADRAIHAHQHQIVAQAFAPGLRRRAQQQVQHAAGARRGIGGMGADGRGRRGGRARRGAGTRGGGTGVAGRGRSRRARLGRAFAHARECTRAAASLSAARPACRWPCPALRPQCRRRPRAGQVPAPAPGGRPER